MTVGPRCRASYVMCLYGARTSVRFGGGQRKIAVEGLLLTEFLVVGQPIF